MSESNQKILHDFHVLKEIVSPFQILSNRVKSLNKKFLNRKRLANIRLSSAETLLISKDNISDLIQIKSTKIKEFKFVENKADKASGEISEIFNSTSTYEDSNGSSELEIQGNFECFPFLIDINNENSYNGKNVRKFLNKKNGGKTSMIKKNKYSKVPDESFPSKLITQSDLNCDKNLNLNSSIDNYLLEIDDNIEIYLDEESLFDSKLECLPDDKNSIKSLRETSESFCIEKDENNKNSNEFGEKNANLNNNNNYYGKPNCCLLINTSKFEFEKERLIVEEETTKKPKEPKKRREKFIDELMQDSFLRCFNNTNIKEKTEKKTKKEKSTIFVNKKNEQLLKNVKGESEEKFALINIDFKNENEEIVIYNEISQTFASNISILDKTKFSNDLDIKEKFQSESNQILRLNFNQEESHLNNIQQAESNDKKKYLKKEWVNFNYSPKMKKRRISPHVQKIIKDNNLHQFMYKHFPNVYYKKNFFRCLKKQQFRRKNLKDEIFLSPNLLKYKLSDFIYLNNSKFEFSPKKVWDPNKLTGNIISNYLIIIIL